MQAVLHDCQRAYALMEEGDVLAQTKCVMRWGKTPEDENVLGRINAMPGYIGGEYNMAGIFDDGWLVRLTKSYQLDF